MEVLGYPKLEVRIRLGLRAAHRFEPMEFRGYPKLKVRSASVSAQRAAPNQWNFVVTLNWNLGSRGYVHLCELLVFNLKDIYYLYYASHIPAIPLKVNWSDQRSKNIPPGLRVRACALQNNCIVFFCCQATF